MLILLSFTAGFVTALFVGQSRYDKKSIALKVFAFSWSLLWGSMTVYSLITDGQTFSWIFDASGLLTLGFVFGKGAREIKEDVEALKLLRK